MRYFIIFCFYLLPVSASYSEPVNFGSTAPDWSLQTKDNETLNFYGDSDGKVSVIFFWATWCPYCATLMPHMEVVYRKYRNKGLKFYAISTNEDGKLDPLEYFEHKKYSYTLLLNGDVVAKEYGVKGTPAVYVLDKSKKVIYKRPKGVSDVLVKQNMNLKIKQALSN